MDRPGLTAGAEKVRRLAVLKTEPVRVKRDRPVEGERRVLARRSADDALLDRDRPRCRRRHDIERVAEDVGHAGREVQVLDVVAIDRVGRAPQRREPILRAGELLRQHRVIRRAALRPQTRAGARLLALLVGQLDRRRAANHLAPDPLVILVIQRRRDPRHDRARKRVGDLRQRTPRAAHRARLKPMTERELPARQRTARILRRASLHPRINQRLAIGVIRRVRTEIDQALLNIVARPISEDVAIRRARPRDERHEIARTSSHRRTRRHPQHASRYHQRHEPAQQRPDTRTSRTRHRARTSTIGMITDTAVIVNRDRPAAHAR